MKPKMRFGVALLSGVASAALLLSQQSFAIAQDDASPDGNDEDALFLRPAGARLADLKGSWTISLGGNTGCGLSALYVTVTLDANGSGSASITGSSTGCPPDEAPAEPFRIIDLQPDGSGTAGLSCGPGCGWTFRIQVPRGNPSLFTLVDVDDPNNVLVGTAARKW